MSETEYASQRNCRFDDGLYADDGFIVELPVSYRTEHFGNSYYRTEFVIFHKRGKLRNWLIFNVEYASVKTQPVLHNWCNKGHGMVHIKEPLLLIGKSSPCGGSGFLLYYPSGPLPYVRRHITVNKMY